MSHVLFSIEDQIATLTLNRPEKLNSVTPEMARAIMTHVQHCNENDQIRAVIITGAGERAFCAGSDIAELDTYDTPWVFRNRPDYCDAIRALRKPAICAINGYALGGGLETAMSCDIRIASDTAKFASPEVKLGWIGGGGMAYMLVHNIGASNAARMLMTGEPVSADTALAWGLVSQVVPHEALQSQAREIAQMIAARPPIAVQTAKTNIRAAYAVPLETAIQYERDLQTICFATQDADEGRRAFKEKRSPVFEGR
ncbi:MAG: enoyl-CoA hydratase/isomerase family protein [Castellaniella sp.]|uniref:enoyl-CoA hydratase/isomerase family protein n=1 Tax=Castellaniella sp. TaxID=1955812 RepID=UPI003A843A4E